MNIIIINGPVSKLSDQTFEQLAPDHQDHHHHHHHHQVVDVDVTGVVGDCQLLLAALDDVNVDGGGVDVVRETCVLPSSVTVYLGETVL